MEYERIAIDFHDICRYDKNPDMKFMRHSKHKSGTTLFNTLASVHCVTEGSRACLGALLRTRDVSPAGAVSALLDVCENNGIMIRTLLLDREFYSTEIMDLLDARGVTWLMPAVKGRLIKKAIAEFKGGRRGGRLGPLDQLRPPADRVYLDHPSRQGRERGQGDGHRQRRGRGRVGLARVRH